MTTFILPSNPLQRRPWLGLLALLALMALVFALQALIAQVSGDRGIAPIASSSDIEVGGIAVDVTAKTGEEAREQGWKQAQRLAWEKLEGPAISDSQLESMVAAVVIEKEQIGARRYVATLTVVFDGARAGAALGGGGERVRSAPLLTIPVLVSGGTSMVYEFRNPWQRAWAEFQTGASAIDYIRPAGSGGESLLVNYGQTGRHSRIWWSNILDEFGAANIIVPIARLEREWPGGPVTGHFTARYGPDNRKLASFTLGAENDEQLPAMLAQAVARFDTIFTDALGEGRLSADPSLRDSQSNMNPTVAALIESARRYEEAELAAAAAGIGGTSEAGSAMPLEVSVGSFVVQYATPDAASVDQGLAGVRSAAGVRGAATSSIAIGGTSVMRVSFAGSLDELAEALRARGWQVNQGESALAISR